MPLVPGDSDEAIAENIRRLIDEGKDPDEAAAIAYANAGRARKSFHYSGPERPRVVFVACDDRTPTPIELVRGAPFVNDDGVVFKSRYLDLLRQPRERIGMIWASPDEVDAVAIELEKRAPVAVVWLGDMRGSGGDREHVALPAFRRRDEVWKSSFKEEIDRKLVALRRKLDARAVSVAPSVRPLLKAARPRDADRNSDAKIVRVHKAYEPKRVIYGVVLDPYQVDLQGDWIPPSDVQETAWGFVEKHGYISDQHEGMADASFVESSIEQYPTPDDYEKAMAGEPHRAYRRAFGDDVVHSGAWVLGVRLSEPLWQQYLLGQIDAFSIEGMGTRQYATPQQMPQVTFVDLEIV